MPAAGRTDAVQQLGTVTIAELQGTVSSCSSVPRLFLWLEAASSAVLEQKKQDAFITETDFEAKSGGLAVSVLHTPLLQFLPKTRTGAVSPLSQPHSYPLTCSSSKQTPDS